MSLSFQTDLSVIDEHRLQALLVIIANLTVAEGLYPEKFEGQVWLPNKLSSAVLSHEKSGLGHEGLSRLKEQLCRHQLLDKRPIRGRLGTFFCVSEFGHGKCREKDNEVSPTITVKEMRDLFDQVGCEARTTVREGTITATEETTSVYQGGSKPPTPSSAPAEPVTPVGLESLRWNQVQLLADLAFLSDLHAEIVNGTSAGFLPYDKLVDKICKSRAVSAIQQLELLESEFVRTNKARRTPTSWIVTDVARELLERDWIRSTISREAGLILVKASLLKPKKRGPNAPRHNPYSRNR